MDDARGAALPKATGVNGDLPQSEFFTKGGASFRVEGVELSFSRSISKLCFRRKGSFMAVAPEDRRPEGLVIGHASSAIGLNQPMGAAGLCKAWVWICNASSVFSVGSPAASILQVGQCKLQSISSLPKR
jgi:hypothetical protein